jgi:hypothetical protein
MGAFESFEYVNFPRPESFQKRKDSLRVRLSWQYPIEFPASNFNLYIADGEDPLLRFIPNTDHPRDYFLVYDDRLFNFQVTQKYHIWLAAETANGFESEYSDTLEIELQDFTGDRPLPPFNLSTVLQDSSVEISWRPCWQTDVDGYNIYSRYIQAQIQ